MMNNRPYGACTILYDNLADIYNNLHAKVGKTALLRILTLLTDKQQLTAKLYGKQTVYVISQVCQI